MCAYAYLHDKKSKDVQIRTQRPFPHWGLRFKSLEKKSIQKKVCHTACRYTNSATIFLPSLSIWRIRWVVKWKTNFLTLDVGDKLVNTDDTALMKYGKKFMQKAVSIMYTVFSFKKEHGRCFHPKSLLRRSKSRSLAPRLLYFSITFFSSLSQSLVMMQR